MRSGNHDNEGEDCDREISVPPLPDGDEVTCSRRQHHCSETHAREHDGVHPASIRGKPPGDKREQGDIGTHADCCKHTQIEIEFPGTADPCHKKVAESEYGAADGHDPAGSEPFAQARRKNTYDAEYHIVQRRSPGSHCPCPAELIYERFEEDTKGIEGSPDDHHHDENNGDNDVTVIESRSSGILQARISSQDLFMFSWYAFRLSTKDGQKVALIVFQAAQPSWALSHSISGGWVWRGEDMPG